MMRRLPWMALVAVVLMFSVQASAQYQARPMISSLDPPSGPPASRVSILGQNFTAEYRVYYNGVELKPIEVTPTKIVVQIPGDAVQGRFVLQGPVHQVTSPQVFWVVASKAAPVISSIAP